jgi:signal transduction histidine kinase
MSHELRTPLNAILGFSTILRDPAFGSLREEQAQYLTHIYSSGKYLLAIVNDLLDLAKVEAGKIELYPEPFTIITMLTAAMADVRPLTVQKHLTLALDTATAPTILTADPLRFKQIVYNLLSNAIKFTPEGGQITVTARTGSKGEDVGSGEGPHAAPMPYALSSGEFVEISVTDTGVGIPAEDMPKLFQPFIQLDSTLVRQYSGTGLGLALTKQLVELHGGWIWAISDGIGCGSTFTACFPSGAH